MPESPAISVLMPVRNGGRYLAPAIQSVLNQTLSDFELLLVDDGSTDGSADVLADYAKRDPRITVMKGPADGLSKAHAGPSAVLVDELDPGQAERTSSHRRACAGRVVPC